MSSTKFFEESADDSAEFVTEKLEDSVKIVKQSTDDSAKFLSDSDKSFSLSFFRTLSSECFFDEKSFDNLNDTLISSLNDFLFLNEIFEVVNLVD